MNDPQQRTVNVGSSSGLAPSTQLIADFKAGMQRLAAAPCVLTTIHQGVRRGLTATAVCSLTADPPTLIACINESAEAFAAMEQAGRLCVNVLKIFPILCGTSLRWPQKKVCQINRSIAPPWSG